MTRVRAWVNRLRRRAWRWVFFRMLFGERSGGALLAGTRISPSTCIEHEERLVLDDDVFIGHFNFIEASAGVRIGRGSQITNYVSIVSHSTHRTVRVAAALSGSDSPASDGAVVRQPIEIGNALALKYAPLGGVEGFDALKAAFLDYAGKNAQVIGSPDPLIVGGPEMLVR